MIMKQGAWNNPFCLFLYSFLLVLPPCLYSMLIVSWWSSNPRSQSIGTLDAVPILCQMHYIIYSTSSSCAPSYPASPLYLPSPPIRFCRCCQFPHTRLFYPLMLPQLMRNPGPHTPHRPLEEVHNWSCCNILRYRVLPLQDVDPNLLKFRLLHSFHQQ